MKKQNDIQKMRGLLILMVVTQHILSIFGGNTDYLLARLLYCIDVEVFFVISGMLYYSKISKYHRNGFFHFFLKKTNELIIPYIIWMALLYLLFFIGLSIPGISTVLSGMGFRKYNIATYAINIILFRDCYIDTLWFVYVLFICFAFYHSTLFISKKRTSVIFCCVVFLSIGTQYYVDVFIVEKVFTGLIAFGCGCIIAKYKDIIEYRISTHRRSLNLIALISFLLCFSVERSKVLPETSFIFAVFSTLSVIVYTVTSYILVRTVIEYIPDDGKIGKLLLKYGNVSYAIYLIHNPYIIYPVWMVSTALFSNTLVSKMFALMLSYSACLLGGTIVGMVNIGKYVTGQKQLLKIGRG